MEGLTVGRIVHYARAEQDYSTGKHVQRTSCAAAIVIRVPTSETDGIADLTVFLPSGDTTWQPDVHPGYPSVAWTWHWPERA